MLEMRSLDLADKRVLIRQDLNTPVKDGVIASDARIRACLPTIEQALAARGRVMVMSHLGRPKEGQFDEVLSMRPVAKCMSELLGREVRLIESWLDGVDIASGEVVMFENVRFTPGEKANDNELAKKMAALCDVYVMDAFGTAHRAHASTHGVIKYAPVACAGPLLTDELKSIAKGLENPARPLVAIVGGSKVSTKLTVLESLSGVVDQLIVGGGIANTFISAAGHNVGNSLYEAELVDEAKRLTESARLRNADIPIPTDVVVGKEFSASAVAQTKLVDQVLNDELIFDIGPDTASTFAALLKNAGTIVWNGPVGVFEFDQFAEGTRAIADAVADSPAYSMAGGGDTIAAMDKFGVADQVSYISTGGGAFLELLEGKQLPSVEMLEKYN